MKTKKEGRINLVLFDSYFKTIKNGVGSNLFRNLYAKINGKKKDILEDGKLSCAVFVSSILRLFKLISEVHATVGGTIADLERSGWIKIPKPKPGAVLVWEAKISTNVKQHQHVGFYVGNNKAISNSTTKRKPVIHHWTYGTKNGQPVRKITQIFWNKKFK